MKRYSRRMADRSISTTLGDIEADVVRALLETLDAGRVGLSIVAVDVDPPEYLYVNAGGPARLGYTIEEFKNLHVGALRAGGSRRASSAPPRSFQRADRDAQAREIFIRHKNGTRSRSR